MTVSLKNLFTVAALSSLSAGILLTLIQQFQVVPAIIEAESYEQSPAVEHGASESGHVHAHTESDHAHDDSAWAPRDGLQRTLFTAGANIVIALGFALLIGAATVLRGITLNWRTGLLWGLAGYAVFFVAPSLGLHPELPGTAAADLQSRQYWWLATIACSAVGLALLVFSPRVVLKILAHVVGAPLPDVHSALAPADLIQRFIIATIIANAVFWLALGGLYGFFQQKLVH